MSPNRILVLLALILNISLISSIPISTSPQPTLASSSQPPPFIALTPKVGPSHCASAVDQKKKSAIEDHITNSTADLIVKESTITVEVYWWVFSYLSKGTYFGNIASASITSQIGVLNKFYSVHGIQFKLIGVKRYYTNRYYNFDLSTVYGEYLSQELKAKFRYGNKKTLNVYSTYLANGVIGKGTFPWDVKTDPLIDGVVIDYGTVPNGYFANYNQGKNLVHEVGHWLGLYHTFEGGCSGSGDYVSDTPAEKYAALESGLCPIGRKTCSSKILDPVQNFMDYSTDPCKTQFTAGQGARMRSLWTLYRA
ncbi:hypothetical protein HK098_002266 [Nowakowskiella sp. JEL0407]|nr:hypothetical protein HK098_002266 [Nowakowskiella sp. JEL0407]